MSSIESLGQVLRQLGIRDLMPDEAAVQDSAEGGPACPRCKGHTFICLDVPRAHPDFGKTFPCQCQAAELAARRRERMERLSNLGSLTRLTFDNLIADGRSPETPEHRHRFGQAVEAARAFSGDPQGWLVLVGPPGCGKTHLAAAIANATIARGEAALFVVVPDLLDHLRATFSPASEASYDELFENVRTTPLLILDDLGTQSSTPWASEKLYQLLNSRYNERLPMVVTTNRSLEDLDERLRVRLTDPEFSRVAHVQPSEPPAIQRLGTHVELLRHMTFATFEPEGRCFRDEQRESLRAALQAAQRFAAQPQGWLVLQGPYGCGKTHLAAAIANHRLKLNQPAIFLSVPELLDHLRSTYGPDSRVTYDELFEMIRTTPLLILDDLGTQSPTAWAEEKLYQLFNFRYNARLPTVVTTNLSIDSLDPRLGSRLGDESLNAQHEIDAPDYRRPEARRRGPPIRRPPPRDQRARR